MIQNLTSLNRCFSLHLTSMIFCRGEYIKSVRVAFAVAGSHAMQDNELLLLVICLLPCVLACVDCLAVVCRAHPSSLAPQSLLHCNIPPQMFAEVEDQRWLLKWAGAHLSPPKSAFLVNGTIPPS